jgi:hypothetical protein
MFVGLTLTPDDCSCNGWNLNGIGLRRDGSRWDFDRAGGLFWIGFVLAFTPDDSGDRLADADVVWLRGNGSRDFYGTLGWGTLILTFAPDDCRNGLAEAYGVWLSWDWEWWDLNGTVRIFWLFWFSSLFWLLWLLRILTLAPNYRGSRLAKGNSVGLGRNWGRRNFDWTSWAFRVRGEIRVLWEFIFRIFNRLAFILTFTPNDSGSCLSWPWERRRRFCCSGLTFSPRYPARRLTNCDIITLLRWFRFRFLITRVGFLSITRNRFGRRCRCRCR